MQNVRTNSIYFIGLLCIPQCGVAPCHPPPLLSQYTTASPTNVNPV